MEQAPKDELLDCGHGPTPVSDLPVSRQELSGFWCVRDRKAKLSSCVACWNEGQRAMIEGRTEFTGYADLDRMQLCTVAGGVMGTILSVRQTANARTPSGGEWQRVTITVRTPDGRRWVGRYNATKGNEVTIRTDQSPQKDMTPVVGEPFGPKQFGASAVALHQQENGRALVLARLARTENRWAVWHTDRTGALTGAWYSNDQARAVSVYTMRISRLLASGRR